MGGASADDYTFTQPADLTVSGAGWNATSGIYASAEEYVSKLVVTASSDFKLTSDHGDTIPFRIRESDGGAEVTSWEFTAEELHAANGTTKTPGIEISAEDVMNARPGNYTIDLTFVVSEVVVDLSKLEADFTAKENYTLTDKLGPAGCKITISDDAEVTLKDATITSIPNNTSHQWAGITPLGDATIILEGTNTVKGGNADYPGIFAAENATLTIKGTGSLDASSNGYGAGIGCGDQISCGNIVIEGGTITATGGSMAAGIGGGNSASCGNITISGGSITATGGEYAAGIGGGDFGSCGSVTITSGVTQVTATKGGDAPHSIGAGDDGSCGTVTIGGQVTGNITTSPYTYTPGS